MIVASHVTRKRLDTWQFTSHLFDQLCSSCKYELFNPFIKPSGCDFIYVSLVSYLFVVIYYLIYDVQLVETCSCCLERDNCFRSKNKYSVPLVGSRLWCCRVELSPFAWWLQKYSKMAVTRLHAFPLWLTSFCLRWYPTSQLIIQVSASPGAWLCSWYCFSCTVTEPARSLTCVPTDGWTDGGMLSDLPVYRSQRSCQCSCMVSVNNHNTKIKS